MQEPATIPELFDEVVRRHADRVALVHRGTTLTYQDLQHRSDDVAALLGRSGVTTETVVGVYAERSVELVVALLGVLKAGGTYVCLAPDHPRERLARILSDAGAKAVLTTGRHREDAAGFGLPVVQVAEDSVPVHGAAGGVAARGATAPDALAYIIFTSGSTGRPKGVGISHRNLLGLVRGQTYAAFGPEEIYLQLSPTSFDASAFEIWAALLSGARLVVPAASYHALDELPDVLRSEAVTMLLLTPPLFHELVRRQIDCLSSVRRLIVGAEAMSLTAARTYLRHAEGRGATFANVYGPTEATTLASCYEITDLEGPDASIPIGSAIEGAAVHLLDEDLQPVVPGATGQIFIGGPGVARGYVGRPGLTAKSFVPDPYSASPGARMYATGDIGRRRPDGGIEFVGRRDDQVKIRGHRVELGEVEAALARCPGVHGVAVTARTTSVGSHQLVAHVVAEEPGNDRMDHELAEFAAAGLPAYLRPATIRLLRAFPLTPSGKIDRKALVAGSDTEGVSAQGVPEAPVPTSADDDRSVLSGIWRRVLGVDDIGPDDDFFALGGDSLLAIRVIADAEASGIEIALADLFATPTIRALAGGDDGPQPPAARAEGPAAGVEDDDVAQRFGPEVESAYPATQMQLGLLFEAEANPDSGLYIDVISRRVSGRFDEASFTEALRLALEQHPALRTGFDLHTLSTPVQLVFAEPVVDLEITDVRGQDPDVSAAAVAAAGRAAGLPFAPDARTLIRFRLVLTAAEEYVLTYGFHHAVMDGWSESVFAADLLRRYDAILRGAAPEPPLPSRGCAEFAALEQQAVGSEETRRFWKERCAALAPTLTSPRAQEGSDRRTLVSAVPQDVVAGLRHGSRLWRLPYKSLIVAGHLAALGRFTGSVEPVTGLIVNGRPEIAESDRLVGLFLNVVPMSVPVTGSWRDIVEGVFEAEKELLPHRRFPFPALREVMGAPLFDVAFNYVQFHRSTELDALEAVHVLDTRIEDKTSFPLAFDVVQSPDGERLVIEAAAAAHAFSAADLDAVAAAHLDVYREIAAEALAAGAARDV